MASVSFITYYFSFPFICIIKHPQKSHWNDIKFINQFGDDVIFRIQHLLAYEGTIYNDFLKHFVLFLIYMFLHLFVGAMLLFLLESVLVSDILIEI